MDKTDKAILTVLNDEKYKARTISGVAKSIKKDVKLVVSRLNASPDLRDTVKIYPRRTKDGKVLITTRERFSKTASKTDKFIDAFSTKRVSIKDEY